MLSDGSTRLNPIDQTILDGAKCNAHKIFWRAKNDGHDYHVSASVYNKNIKKGSQTLRAAIVIKDFKNCDAETALRFTEKLIHNSKVAGLNARIVRRGVVRIEGPVQHARFL
jgi:hypothetical protein